MRIAGIDPGLKGCGVALLEDGNLSLVITIRVKPQPLAARVYCIAMAVQQAIKEVDLLVIEKMQVYKEKKNKDPNDLIDLSLLSGAIMMSVPHDRCLLPTPAQWKGQVPKKIHHARIRARIPNIGRASMDALDAVGLALYGSDYAKTQRS